MKKTKDLKANKGITLIALVITIIVMLILVAVTISMAVNGGLFNYAGKAAGETDNAIRDEQALGNGGINVNGVWYNSIDEYLNKTPVQDDGKIEVVEPENIDDWEYIVEEDGTITLTMYKGSDTVVVIPNHINGIPVKKIGTNKTSDKAIDSLWGSNICDKDYTDADYNTKAMSQKTITKIIVSEGIEIIEDSAFYYSVALQEVIMPSTITNMGNSSFSNCKNLTSISIPLSVTNIGNSAFIYCTSLTNITIPSSVKSIGGYAFYRCTGITNITIPSSVTSIGGYAFNGGSITLKDVIIEGKESNVEIIEPENIEDWEYRVEEDNTITITKYKGKDTEVVIPNYINGVPVKKIGTSDSIYQGASLWHSSLYEELSQEEYDELGTWSAQKTITKVIISEGIEVIYANVFVQSRAMKEIVIPSTITSIGERSFVGCSATVKYRGFEGIWTLVNKKNSYINENAICNYSEQ